MTTIVYYYVHFDFTKFAIFGDPVLSQLELRSVRVMYTVLLVSVLTVRIFEYNCKTSRSREKYSNIITHSSPRSDRLLISERMEA